MKKDVVAIHMGNSVDGRTLGHKGRIRKRLGWHTFSDYAHPKFRQFMTPENVNGKKAVVAGGVAHCVMVAIEALLSMKPKSVTIPLREIQVDVHDKTVWHTPRETYLSKAQRIANGLPEHLRNDSRIIVTPRKVWRQVLAEIAKKR